MIKIPVKDLVKKRPQKELFMPKTLTKRMGGLVAVGVSISKHAPLCQKTKSNTYVVHN